MRHPRCAALRAVKRILAATLACAYIGGTASAQEVIPDFYKEAGQQPNRDFVNQQYAENIDPFTGALQMNYVDVHLPGNGGLDLKVVRSYSSAGVIETNPAAYEGQAGVGWTIHFGRAMHKNNTLPCSQQAFGISVLGNPVIELPDGSRQLLVFTGNVSPMMLTTQRWRADCAAGGNGLVVYSPDGVRYDMTQQVGLSGGRATWYTTKITDRNGNTITVNYKAAFSPEISSVSTSDGRSITFSYLDSGQLTRRISSISTSGFTYSYNYTGISGWTGIYQLTSVTRPGGTQWRYAYNGSGSSAGAHMMSSMTMPEGGVTNYSYEFVYFDAASNPMSRSSVVSRKTTSDGTWTFAYDPGSTSSYDQTTVSTPAGTITYKHIGPNYASSGSVWKVGLLMEKRTGTLQTETYTWDKQKISSQNNVRPGAFITRVDAGETNAPVMASRSIVRDGSTFSTTYSSFDTYGNPQAVSESGGGTYGKNRTTSLTYHIDTSRWIVKQTKNESVSGGMQTTRSFDSDGNLTSISRDGVTTSHSYDSQGNISQTTFPRSLSHSYSSYKRGIPQSESQPESVSISRSVSDAGNITSETNGEGRTTSYSYDGLNRVTSINYPAGNSVSISYTSTSKTASRGSLSEVTRYDGYGRATSITLGGIEHSYDYDALGRMTFASNPGSSAGTDYSYDILDRQTSMRNADSSSRSISYGGGTMSVRNERSKTTTYGYRSYGNPDERYLMNVSAPESSASLSVARNDRNLVTSIAQGGITRSYGYNSNNYLTSVSNPETGTTSYGRDAAGNMTTRSVGSSGSTSYSYDSQNRLETVNYPNSTPAVTQTYSKTHKLKTVNSSAATLTYGYDSNDNVISTQLGVDGRTYTTGLSYNSNDQLSSITYPQTGTVVSYAPDTLGRPTQVSGFVSSVAYWPSGQVKTINYSNGTVSSYGQNSRLWPSSFQSSKSGTNHVNASYSYDGVGNLTSINDTADSSYNRSLGYDDVNRLTSVSGPWGSGSIGYSGSGNLTSQSYGGSTMNYNYDSQNRLSSVSGSRSSSYSYDAYGDITAAYGNTYSYNGVPNLICALCSDPVNRADYVYNGQNQRVSVTQGGVKTHEVYGAHGGLLLEYVPTTGRTVEYFYLGGKRVAQRTTDKATSTTLGAAPNTVAIGLPVTLTANVSGTNPTGNVTFMDGATALGTAPVTAGAATLAPSFTTLGSHSLTASYAGDANNNASTSAAVVVNVTKAVSKTKLVAPADALVGATVKLVAKVTGYNPTGTVTFMEGATTLGTATINAGKAVFSTSFATAGEHRLTASYAGDANNEASTSKRDTVIVNAMAARAAAPPGARDAAGKAKQLEVAQ